MACCYVLQKVCSDGITFLAISGMMPDTEPKQQPYLFAYVYIYKCICTRTHTDSMCVYIYVYTDESINGWMDGLIDR